MQASSESNVLCFNLPMNVVLDYDAFVPGLENYSDFGPRFDFLPSEYKFQVFNRTGTRVFETTNAQNPRWNGRYNNDGDTVPEGVYRYYLEYMDERGEKVVQSGRVTVVRQ